MTLFNLWNNSEKTELDPKLFSVTANQFAEKIAEEGKRDKKKNKPTQLRRFFDEILRLNVEAQRKDDNWKLIHPRVHMVMAKVAYAKGRDLVTDDFLKLMRCGIDQVENKDDLRAFTDFLESFMGFYKMHNPKD